MKTLIVAPRNPISGNSADFNYLFPLGLSYISSALKAAGHEVDCLNLNHHEGNVTELVAAKLSAGKPYGAVCTGGLSTAYLPVKRIVETVRSCSQAKVILGGGLVSSEPELMFTALKPDYVVLGEGEETAQQLMRCLEEGSDPSKVEGIGYTPKGNGFVTTTARAPIQDLDKIPLPDFEGLEFETYLDHLTPTSQYFYDLFDHPRAYPLITSRSCPFSCTFCFHPIGKKYRQRSMDSIMAELEAAIPRYRINLVSIYDELFASNRERLVEFCERFSQLMKKTPWEVRWGCQLRVDKLDEQTLALMKQAGCFMVSYGFESYSPEVLKSMKKHITPAQIHRAVELTAKHQISLQGNFIFGDKAETLQTARETLSYWKTHSNSGIVLGYISPFPGTELYASCVSRGVIKDRLDFIENHLFDILNMSETMSERDFLRLQVEITVCKLRHYIVAVPFQVDREPSGMYTVHVKCPHCGQQVRYGNFNLPGKSLYKVITYCRCCRRRFFMMSRAYLLITTVLAALVGITPMALKLKLFVLLGKFRTWMVKKILTGAIDLKGLRRLVQT